MGDIRSVTYEGAVTPTKSDTIADPLGLFVGIYVGAAGNVKLTTIRGQDVTFTAPIVGTIIPIAHTRVWSTGTTATILCLQASPYKSGSS